MATEEQTTGDVSPSISPKKFYIFGHHISHSLSPALHNAGFRALNLPHHYAVFETPQMNADNRAILESPDFGGASVTFPHKLAIPQFLDTLSSSAERIGATNTVVVRRNDAGARVLVGDNTDYLGIKSCIEQASAVRGERRALIIGAGGAARAAARALEDLGVRDVTLVNRTRSTAERLAATFSALEINCVSSLRELPPSKPFDLIIGCVPSEALTKDDIAAVPFAPEGGVLVEMAYRPLVTELIVAATGLGWKVFGGTDVLQHQAFAQFELWTGRTAPREAMVAGMMQAKASL